MIMNSKGNGYFSLLCDETRSEQVQKRADGKNVVTHDFSLRFLALQMNLHLSLCSAFLLISGL